MKHLIYITLIILLLSCNKEKKESDTQQSNAASLIGKWEFIYLDPNGNNQQTKEIITQFNGCNYEVEFQETNVIPFGPRGLNVPCDSWEFAYSADEDSIYLDVLPHNNRKGHFEYTITGDTLILPTMFVTEHGTDRVNDLAWYVRIN